jgi:hypothetical protein
MRKTNRLLIGSAVLASMLTAPVVHGDVRRTTPERRPYITELGEPYGISFNTLDSEARKNSDMRAYLTRYGWPDYAEIQEIIPEWPWESYEVRMFYLHRNLEVDFSHVVVSRALTDYGLLRYQGSIPSMKRHEIEVILEARNAPPPPPPPAVVQPQDEPSSEPAPQTSGDGLSEEMVRRIETAVDRAVRAADVAAEQSARAASAAERTVDLVDKMEAGLP